MYALGLMVNDKKFIADICRIFLNQSKYKREAEDGLSFTLYQPKPLLLNITSFMVTDSNCLQ